MMFQYGVFHLMSVTSTPCQNFGTQTKSIESKFFRTVSEQNHPNFSETQFCQKAQIYESF